MPPLPRTEGGRRATDALDAYVAHLLSYVDPQVLKPLKVVVNAGNGCAGPVLDALEKHLPFQFIKIHHEPDPTFPHGVPNPLLPENRQATAEAVRDHGAAVGLAWDGDFDRCFFFDEQGAFIEGYYLVGFLAQALLAASPRRRHHPRPPADLEYHRDGAGGRRPPGDEQDRPRLHQGAHAGRKRPLRRGDVRAPLLPGFRLLRQRHDPLAAGPGGMCRTGQPLSALVRERMARYPCSGEINRKLPDPEAALQRVEAFYQAEAIALDRTDGLSLEFPDWRFNLRPSNTEPVLRLNVETRQDPALLKEKTDEILALMT